MFFRISIICMDFFVRSKAMQFCSYLKRIKINRLIFINLFQVHTKNTFAMRKIFCPIFRWKLRPHFTSSKAIAKLIWPLSINSVSNSPNAKIPTPKSSSMRISAICSLERPHRCIHGVALKAIFHWWNSSAWKCWSVGSFTHCD